MGVGLQTQPGPPLPEGRGSSVSSHCWSKCRFGLLMGPHTALWVHTPHMLPTHVTLEGHHHPHLTMYKQFRSCRPFLGHTEGRCSLLPLFEVTRPLCNKSRGVTPDVSRSGVTLLHLLRVKSLKVPLCWQSLFCLCGNSHKQVCVEPVAKGPWTGAVFPPPSPRGCRSDSWEAALWTQV